MSSFELNKIFAAVLVAGIVAMLSGFIAEQMVHPHGLETNAVEIEGAPEVSAGGAAGPTLPEPILDLIATADVAKGQNLSKACAACHSFNQGEAAKIGPNLWNTVGANKGGHDFAYSDDMKKHGGTWTYEELNHFLWKPKSLIPGTKMTYIGIKKPADRAAAIAWLRTLSSSPKPLPTEAEIAQEKADFAPAVDTAPTPDVTGVAGEAPVNAPSSGVAESGGKPVDAPATENIKSPDAPSDVDTKQPE